MRLRTLRCTDTVRVCTSLLLILTCAHAYRRNASPRWKRQGISSLVVMRLKNWMMNSKLMLNEQKAEVFLGGPLSRREGVPVDSLHSALHCGEHAWINFGCFFLFDQHVSAVVMSCFFHVRSLSKIRSYLIRKAACSIAVSLILSKLDYLLAGLPETQI